MFSIIIIGVIFLKENVLTSEAATLNVTANLNDVIGVISIPKINFQEMLLQGLDNEFYYTHNFLKYDDMKGEVFLDYQGDLLNKNNMKIYANKERIENIDDLNAGDIINIFYIDKDYCYEVIDKKKGNYLIIVLKSSKKTNNIIAKEINC